MHVIQWKTHAIGNWAWRQRRSPFNSTNNVWNKWMPKNQTSHLSPKNRGQLFCPLNPNGFVPSVPYRHLLVIVALEALYSSRPRTYIYRAYDTRILMIIAYIHNWYWTACTRQQQQQQSTGKDINNSNNGRNDNDIYNRDKQQSMAKERWRQQKCRNPRNYNGVERLPCYVAQSSTFFNTTWPKTKNQCKQQSTCELRKVLLQCLSLQ